MLKTSKVNKGSRKPKFGISFYELPAWLLDREHDAATKMAEMATAISKQVLKETEKSKGKQ